MNVKRKNSIFGGALLALAAVIWGSSFVAQSTGSEFVGPFTFISIRSFLGSAVLLPFIFAMDSFKKKKNPEMKKMVKADYLYLIKVGTICGVALFVASELQQIGIDQGTPAGRAGFITALYILLVPIFSIFLKKKIRPIIWPCVIVSIVALYLLCVTDNTVRASDIYVLICAFCFAIHILVIDKVSPNVDGVRLSCFQFFVCGIISGIFMLCVEDVSLEALKSAAPSIIYSGIMSSGIAYTLQILGQQKTEPTIASMIMSLESVFSVLTAMVVLHEIPSFREAIGCVLMFAAIIVAQLPEKKKRDLQKDKDMVK